MCSSRSENHEPLWSICPGGVCCKPQPVLMSFSLVSELTVGRVDALINMQQTCIFSPKAVTISYIYMRAKFWPWETDASATVLAWMDQPSYARPGTKTEEAGGAQRPVFQSSTVASSSGFGVRKRRTHTCTMMLPPHTGNESAPKTWIGHMKICKSTCLNSSWITTNASY